MDELAVLGRARQLIGDVNAAPLDVLELARNQGMVVTESDQLEPDEAGRTFQRGGHTYVILNEHDHPYRRRWPSLNKGSESDSSRSVRCSRTCADSVLLIVSGGGRGEGPYRASWLPLMAITRAAC